MKATPKTSRRKFIKSGAAAGGLLILPSGSLLGANAPSNKLNIALIGAWGRGKAHHRVLKEQTNVVALCDIHENNLAEAVKVFPEAKTYFDWRILLDERKDLDAVVCCTPDHTHAFIATWAMNRGLHVYCEKPLANCVNEARVARATYIENKDKLATQVGTQRHADSNFNRVRELITDGAIGELDTAYAWGNRQIRRDAYLPDAGAAPSYIHYDLWIGPSPMHPYNPGYFSAPPGANCLQWNMFWDFGSGQIGDMGSHTIDLLWNAVDAKIPTTAFGEALDPKGKPIPVNPDVTPVEMHSSFDHPANDWRGPLKVHWYQGGMMPRSPSDWIDLNKIGHGAMFKGSKGYLICDFNRRMLIPFGKNADLSYFDKRPNDKLIPDMGGFQEQWINACKDPANIKTSCDMIYSGDAIEQMLLGQVSYRVGKKFNYDPIKGTSDNDEANALLTRKYRPGWVLNG